MSRPAWVTSLSINADDLQWRLIRSKPRKWYPNDLHPMYFSSAILSRTLIKFKLQILPVIQRNHVIHYPATCSETDVIFLDCDVMHTSFRGKKIEARIPRVYHRLCFWRLINLLSFSTYLNICKITVLISLCFRLHRKR